MSLDNGKLVFLNKTNSNNIQFVKAKGKVLRFGSLCSCDVVLDNKNAKQIHCEIQCDAFGRITIINYCEMNPITVNGILVQNKQHLFNGAKIKLFDEEFVWQYKTEPDTPKLKHEVDNILEVTQAVTPKNQLQMLTQAPNSEPPLRGIKCSYNRVTFYSVAHEKELIQDDLEKKNDSFKENEVLLKDSHEKTFEFDNQIETSMKFSKCNLSSTALTSYSPRIGSRNSFVLLKTNINPSVLSEIKPEKNQSYLSSQGTPQKLKNSMHLIDLTTPIGTAKKNLSVNIKSRTKSLGNSFISTPTNKTSNCMISRKSIINVSNAVGSPRTPKSVNKINLSEQNLTPKRLNTFSKITLSPKRQLYKVAIKSAVKSLNLKESANKSNNLSGLYRNTIVNKEKHNKINDFGKNVASTSTPVVSKLSIKSRMEKQNKTVTGTFSNRKEQIISSIRKNEVKTLKLGNRSVQQRSEKNNISEVLETNSINENIDEIEDVYMTPISKGSSVNPTTNNNSNYNATNIEEITDDIDDSFKTSESLNMNLDKSDSVICLSSEEQFDKLTGKPCIKHSYSRGANLSKSTQQLDIKSSDLPKTDIQEWVESINESVNTIADQVNITGISILDDTATSDFPELLVYSDDDEIVAKSHLENDNLSVNLNTTFDIKNESIDQNENINEESKLNLEQDSEIFKESSKKVSLSETSNVNCETETSKIIQKIVTPQSLKDTIMHVSRTMEKETTSQTLDVENRKTMDNEVTGEVLDLEQEKEKVELETAFKNFDENPDIGQTTNKCLTPGAPKVKTMIRRKTMGNEVTSECLNLEQEKERVELETAFKNFKENLDLDQTINKCLTPEVPKAKSMINRKTMGNEVTSEGLNLEQEKEKVELETAFKNFDENPDIGQTTNKCLTPEAPKVKTMINRKTMGNEVTSEALDLKKEKERVELETAFKNFEENPDLGQTTNKCLTPEAPKSKMIISRKTMGNEVTSEALDLEKEKERVELETAFKNFEQNPDIGQTTNKCLTPEAPKARTMINRKTMGNEVTSEALDLEKEKERVELETAFKNFEENPDLGQTTNKCLTPEAPKARTMINRKTMGNEVTSEALDLEKEKERVELETAFKNFEENPDLGQTTNKCLTPEAPKARTMINRKTMGNEVTSEALDLEKEKERVELETAFKNFEQNPDIGQTTNKCLTPEAPKVRTMINRKTMGNEVTSEALDLEKEKERVELETAFKNFEQNPDIGQTTNKCLTPEAPKVRTMINRKTMGNEVTSEALDLEKEKERVELETAFKNFEENPDLGQTTNKCLTPEAPKAKMIINRKTMGNEVTSEALDLEKEKERVELETAFKNFEENPDIGQTTNKCLTPEAPKARTMINRKTVGNEVTSEALDLEKEKERVELETAFKNFEENPDLGQTTNKCLTPEAPKAKMIINRKTMGNEVTSEALDLEKEKERVELETAFKNFEENPDLGQTTNKCLTPEAPKAKMIINRKTMGNEVTSEALDLEKEKERVELETAFKNFEENPDLGQTTNKCLTPKAPKAKMIINRKTMGNEVTSEALDLEKEKERVELETAFKNFEENPDLGQTTNKCLTPEAPKAKMIINRKTMGNEVTSEALDLGKEKERVELETAFKYFEENPDLDQTTKKCLTPEVPKAKMIINRKTMGNEVTSEALDLEKEKKRVELETAFKNFEENADVGQTTSKCLTPEAPKAKADNSKTVSNDVENQTLNLKAETEKANVIVKNEKDFHILNEIDLKKSPDQIEEAEAHPQEVKKRMRGVKLQIIKDKDFQLEPYVVKNSNSEIHKLEINELTKPNDQKSELEENKIDTEKPKGRKRVAAVKNDIIHSVRSSPRIRQKQELIIHEKPITKPKPVRGRKILERDSLPATSPIAVNSSEEITTSKIENTDNENEIVSTKRKKLPVKQEPIEKVKKTRAKTKNQKKVNDSIEVIDVLPANQELNTSVDGSSISLRNKEITPSSEGNKSQIKLSPKLKRNIEIKKPNSRRGRKNQDIEDEPIENSSININQEIVEVPKITNERITRKRIKRVSKNVTDENLETVMNVNKQDTKTGSKRKRLTNEDVLKEPNNDQADNVDEIEKKQPKKVSSRRGKPLKETSIQSISATPTSSQDDKNDKRVLRSRRRKLSEPKDEINEIPVKQETPSTKIRKIDTKKTNVLVTEQNSKNQNEILNTENEKVSEIILEEKVTSKKGNKRGNSQKQNEILIKENEKVSEIILEEKVTSKKVNKRRNSQKQNEILNKENVEAQIESEAAVGGTKRTRNTRKKESNQETIDKSSSEIVHLSDSNVEIKTPKRSTRLRRK